MTTRITQFADEDGGRTILRVEGSLHVEDAAVLESAYATLRAGQAGDIAIDLAEISFLDNESASVLCRLRRTGAELVGLHFFIRQVIELAEKSGAE